MEKEAVLQWVQDIQSVSLDPVEIYRGHFSLDTSSVPTTRSTDLHFLTTPANPALPSLLHHKPRGYSPDLDTVKPFNLSKTKPLPIQVIKPTDAATTELPKIHSARQQVMADGTRHGTNLNPLRSSFSPNSMDSPIPLSNPDMVLPTITLTKKDLVIPKRKPLIKRSVSNDQEIQSRTFLPLLRSSTVSTERSNLVSVDEKYSKFPKSAPVSPEFQNRRNRSPHRTLRECVSQADIRIVQRDRKQASGFESVDRRSGSDVAEKHSLSERSSDDLEMPNMHHSEGDVIFDARAENITSVGIIDSFHQEPSLVARNINRKASIDEKDDHLGKEPCDTETKGEGYSDGKEKSEPDKEISDPDDKESDVGMEPRCTGAKDDREEELLRIMKKWYYQGYSEKADLVQALRLTGHRLSADKLILENSDTALPWAKHPSIQNDVAVPTSTSPSMPRFTKQTAIDRSPSPSNFVAHDAILPDADAISPVIPRKKKPVLRKTQTFSFDTSNEFDVAQLPRQPKFLSKKNPLKRSSSIQQQDISGSSRTSSSSRNSYLASPLGISHMTSHDTYLSKRSPTLDDLKRESSPIRRSFIKSPTLEDHRAEVSPVRKSLIKSPTLEDHETEGSPTRKSLIRSPSLEGSSPSRRTFTLEDPRREGSSNRLGNTKPLPLSSLLRNDQLNLEARQRLSNFVIQNKRVGDTIEEQYTEHSQWTNHLAVTGSSPATELAVGPSPVKEKVQNLSSIKTPSNKDTATRQDSGIGTLSSTSDDLKHML